MYRVLKKYCFFIQEIFYNPPPPLADIHARLNKNIIQESLFDTISYLLKYLFYQGCEEEEGGAELFFVELPSLPLLQSVRINLIQEQSDPRD